MADKKSPGRFTLNFNVEDPKQIAAVSILNRQGRAKARFITEAILHYINCPESPGIELPPSQMDEERIKQIVCSLLEQVTSRPQIPSTDVHGELAPMESVPASVAVAADSPFDENQLAVIAKTMAAFN